MRSIISTVGKSLLSNTFRNLDKKDVESVTKQEMANYLRHTDDTKASAESNALIRLIQNQDKLVFLHSETEEGQKCASVLMSYYNNKGYEVEEREVEGLNYEQSKFKMQGLRFLVDSLIKIIEKEKQNGREVLINATGGFKAEIAYATMIGLLMKVPVYYIHEIFDDIIEMPSSPIDWDYSFIAEFEDFFEWISADLRKVETVKNKLSEIESRIKSYSEITNKSVNDIRLLLNEEEDFMTLSPAGETYFRTFRNFKYSSEKADIYLSNQAKRKYENMKPDLKNNYKKIFQKLAIKKLWSAIAGQKKGDSLVYPQGHIAERVFFYEDNNDIYVLELTSHSNKSYERELETGVWKEDYSKFSKLSQKDIWQ